MLNRRFFHPTAFDIILIRHSSLAGISLKYVTTRFLRNKQTGLFGERMKNLLVLIMQKHFIKKKKRLRKLSVPCTQSKFLARKFMLIIHSFSLYLSLSLSLSLSLFVSLFVSLSISLSLSLFLSSLYLSLSLSHSVSNNAWTNQGFLSTRTLSLILIC
jgi:hypothetical protein